MIVPRERSVYDGPVTDGAFPFTDEDAEVAARLAAETTPARPSRPQCCGGTGWVQEPGPLVHGVERTWRGWKPCAGCNADGAIGRA